MNATHRIIDHQYHGLATGAFSYPQEWEAASQVVWRFEDTSNPCSVFAKTWNPQGAEQFEVFPQQPFYWLQWGGAQEGQFSRGLMALRPRPVVEVLQHVVLPRFRPQFQILQVGRESRLPPPPVQVSVCEQVGVRIAYGEFEEYILALQLVLPSPDGNQINWGVDQLFAFRAARGQLDAALPRLNGVFATYKVNPKWQQMRTERQNQINAEVQRFFQQVGDYHRSVAMAAQQQLTYIQHSSQVSQRIYDTHWYADEHIQRGRGEVLSGVETYRDPYYGTSEHGYHKFVYTDGQGNYKYSDDPNYNPNLNASRQWNPLEKLP